MYSYQDIYGWSFLANRTCTATAQWHFVCTVTVCQRQTVFVLAEVGFCGKKQGGKTKVLKLEGGD